MSERDLSADLALALELADAADARTLPRFEAADFTIAWKADSSEVSEVDRTTEAMLAERVAAARPGDGFFGEEYGLQGELDADWRWIVDPIDGTSGFVRGMPIWATLIALLHRNRGADGVVDEVMVAVVSAPAMQRRWWAIAGDGSFASVGIGAEGRQLAVSDVGSVAEAQVNVTINDGWHQLGATDALVGLMVEARRSRGVGDFWQHCLVAEGALDAAIDAIGVAPYDLAAVRLIVTEAGGRFTDRHGVDTHASNSAISTNGRLHDQVLARLA